MLKIRQYRLSDKPDLQNICVETTLFPKTKKVRRWLPLAYNDYYTEKQSGFVYVLADENDKAVGYILCAPDEKEFRRAMFSEYLPKIRKISLPAYLLLKKEFSEEDTFYGEYPAHLHIDISEPYQRMGMGSKLVDYLLAKLSEQKIAGVKLSCAVNNKKGVSFYKKYGFTELGKSGNCIIFGYKTGV